MRMELGDGNNYFHDFFVDFWKEKTVIHGKEYLAGQIASEMLNCSDEEIATLMEDGDELAKHFNQMVDCASVTPEIMRGITGILARMNTKFLNLPMYQRLEVDISNHNKMSKFYSYPKNCLPLNNNSSTEFRVLFSHVSYYAQAPRGLQKFRGVIIRLEKDKFSQLKRRDTESYAKAARQFFNSNPYTSNRKPFPLQKATGEYVPFMHLTMAYIFCADPKDKNRTIIAERTFFEDMFSFLASDFYRGLQYGHAPMKCANCGRYFLNDKGYANRRYCDGRDPDQPEYTCRQVGAYNTNGEEEKGKEPADSSAPSRLCSNAKNRFRGLYRYGTISEANLERLLNEVDKLKAKALRGKLTDAQLEEALLSETLYRQLKINKLN